MNGPAGGVTTEGGQGEGFRFRRLEKPEEFRQVEELCAAAWGPSTAFTVTPPWMRVLQDNGGLVLGAFADIYLAGAAVSLLGWDGTDLYHYAQLTVVRPEYQNHHLGFRLKAFQRDEVLQLGLREIRSTIDPLQSRNAGLFVHRLGALPDRYLTHYFGRLDDAVHGGSETDRIRLRWRLSTPSVEERLIGKLPGAAEYRDRWERSRALVETDAGETGLRVPTAVTEPTGPSAHLEVPFDLGALQQHDPSALRQWRHAVRDAFTAAFELGYLVDDFAIVAPEHERRSFYFLSKAPEPPAGPAVGSV